MIRDLRIEDASSIKNINDISLGYIVPIDLLEKQIAKLSKDSHHFFLVYEDIETTSVVGYIHAEVYESLLSETGFNIIALAVLPEFQGMGIGKKLLLELEKETIKRGYRFIRLSSNVKRTEAHKFYELNGYVSNKEQKRFAKEF